MRKLLFKLHLIVAIVFGVFIVLLGVTGAEMAFEQEIEHVLHWKLTHVAPAGQRLTLVQIEEIVRRAYPDEKVTRLGLPTSDNSSCAVVQESRAVYVNPYSGAILGIETDGFDILNFIHGLHLRLALMDKGRTFGETTIKTSGVAALFLLVTGAYLWWPTKRVAIGRSDGTRRFWFDLHNAFGIVSLVFVLLLVLTGLVIGFEEQTTPLFYKLTHSQPPPRLRLQATPAPGATPITPDQALTIARAAAPGAMPTLINVVEGKDVYRINARYPEDLTPGGRTRIAIDPYSGKVLLLVDSRSGPGGYKLVNLNRAIHTGDIFGMPSKIVMSLASLVMVLQLVTGVVMWWKRRGAQGKARVVAASNKE